MKKKGSKSQPYFLNNCDYCIHYDEETDSCNIGGLDDDVKCINMAEVRAPYELDKKAQKDVIKWYREDMPDFLMNCSYCRYYESHNQVCSFMQKKILIPAYDGLECENYVLLPLDDVGKKIVAEIRTYFKAHPFSPSSPLAKMRSEIHKYQAKKMEELKKTQQPTLADIVDLKNCKVRHQKFGVGTVVESNSTSLYVEFPSEKRRIQFRFPEAIGSYLTIMDSEDGARKPKNASAIQREIDEMVEQKELREDRMLEECYKYAIDRYFNEKYETPKERPQRRMANRTQRKSHRSNVAFKLNYCDGGKTAKRIGFYGACSDTVIRHNIEKEHRFWCSDPQSACRQYYDGQISYRELKHECNAGGFVCYESAALRDWIGYAGMDGNRTTRKIRCAVPLKLGIFTTILPNERDRLIFGAFLMREIFEGDDNEQGMVHADQDYRLELTPSEARQVRFWDYYRNVNKPNNHQWSSGLIRYFDDETAVKILRAMESAKQDIVGKRQARRLLERYCEVNHIT